MMALTTTITVQISEDLREFLTSMVHDAAPYRSISAYFEELIRRDKACSDAAAIKQMHAELAAGFGAPESGYHASFAAEVTARNR